MTPATNYLGKEQTLNVLFLRFNNVFFDDTWNHDHTQCVVTSHKQKYYSDSNKKNHHHQMTIVVRNQKHNMQIRIV